EALLVQRCREPAAESADGVGARCRGDDPELVSADARDLVAVVELAAEEVGRAPEEVVADRMAIAVVGLLERIHVREDQAEGLAELGARRKRGVEGARVEEAREEIALLGDAEAIAELAIAVRVPADEGA